MAAPLPRVAVVTQGLLYALLAWLYGGDLVRFVRAMGAEAALLVDLPNLALAACGVGVLAGGVALLGVGLARGRDAAWRGYRLGPVAGVLLLFLDLAVLSSMRSPMTADDRLLLAVAALSEGAAAHASHEAVPDDPRLPASFVADLQPVPLFRHGERVEAWTVDVRRECAGPASDARGKPPGTLVYCLAADGKRAWVTAVAVPRGQTFGAPSIVSIDEPWMQEVQPAVAAPENAEPDEASPQPGDGLLDVRQAPTPVGAGDSSR